MRIIIKESQLKLIVEQREESVKDDLINRAKEYTSIVDLFNNDRELYHTLKKRYILYDIFPHSVRTQILIDKAKKYKTISTLRLREPELFKKLRDRGLIDELFPIKKTFIPNIPSDEENYPPNTNLQENIQRIKEVMGVKDNAPFNNVIVWVQDRERHVLYDKGTVYAWLYDDPEGENKLYDGEYDTITFPTSGGIYGGSENLLTKIWSKQYSKSKRGIEHLMGIIMGWWDEDNNILRIDMMTVNPKMRRQGINSYMIQELRKHFDITQDQITFDKPTDQGQKFIDSKQYE